MNTIHHPGELPGTPQPVCLAIGVFDGVHIGHQQVIRQAIFDASHHEAESVVVTFDRHPNEIVAPQSVPRAIYSLEQKLESIAELGVQTTLLIRFDAAFSAQPAEQFIRELHDGFGQLRSICVGREFTFGHRRSGNVELLGQLGAQLGFKVHGLAAVALDGEIVSSTRIRQAIARGRLDRASQMLGRDYKLHGRVIHGDGIGRTLGFPTANVDLQGIQLPPNGVYAVHLFLENRRFRGVANIGLRPTVSEQPGTPRLEVHLLDFDGDLYGCDANVQFLDFLRPETRFASLAELKSQIAQDVHAAAKLFKAGRQ